MTNFFKCLTCKKILINEEGKNHTECAPFLKKFKTILASSYYITENDRNESCLVIDGIDGIGYTFVIKEPNLIPIELPFDTHQPKGNAYKNNSEGNNTFQKVLSKLDFIAYYHFRRVWQEDTKLMISNKNS